MTNYTDTTSWTIQDLIDALGDIAPKKNKITIPKFQRTLVWKKEQQKAFIDSIKKGFPVGAILLYKSTTDKLGNTIYSLIDGLQRSTAINQYQKAPTQFFDETNLDEKFISEVYALIENSQNLIEKDSLSTEIVSWITNLVGFEEAQQFSSYHLSNHLNKKLKLNLTVDNLEILIDKFIPELKKIKDEANIYQFKIPILIYTGEQFNLPIIFERLNSKGTQLSKYQIYAATWTTYQNFKIANREIIEGIKNKYDSLIEEGYEVENYDSSPKFFTSEFSTFEYLFGFGKFLTKNFNYLFSSNAYREQEDSIGFNIMNICLGKPFENMNEIPELLKKYEIKDFENAIMDSINFVFNCLKGHITLKMNKKNKIMIAHSELQIVSMIGKAFHSKYNDDLSVKDTWDIIKTQLEQNLTYHYLYDIIRAHWRGSGDSKAYNLAFSDRYETSIRKNAWESAFQDWFDYDLSKKEKNRVNVKDTAILFYKYLYSYSLTAYEEISRLEFDIEHLIPIEKLKEIVGATGIPISAFPNLCLLDSRLNRQKGSLTFYEFFKKKVELNELTDEQATEEIQKIEKYSHTTEGDFSFIESDFSLNNYKVFLENRFKILKNLFYDFNNIQD